MAKNNAVPKVFTSKTQKTGEIGEHVAVRYLLGKGYSVLERNYTKKWGEIDVVAAKGRKTYFIEVKSKTGDSVVSDKEEEYRPEDNMHPWKIERLRRTIQTYLAEHSEIGEWQFGLIVVIFDPSLHSARISYLENIII